MHAMIKYIHIYTYICPNSSYSSYRYTMKSISFLILPYGPTTLHILPGIFCALKSFS